MASLDAAGWTCLTTACSEWKHVSACLSLPAPSQPPGGGDTALGVTRPCLARGRPSERKRVVGAVGGQTMAALM